MECREIPWAGLELDRGEIYRTMGSSRYVPDREMQERIERVIAEAGRVCRARFGYEVLPAGMPGPRAISAGGAGLATGSVITPCLVGAEYYALFVATAGVEFDAWLHGLQVSGDLLDQFIADAVGSEIAEAAARQMAGLLGREAAVRGMRISNSYSPGYCGWPVRDQRALFGLLPPRPCGVELNASCLMSPVKSVSGVVAIGRSVEKKPYGCAACGKKDCYKKRVST